MMSVIDDIENASIAFVFLLIIIGSLGRLYVFCFSGRVCHSLFPILVLSNNLNE